MTPFRTLALGLALLTLTGSASAQQGAAVDWGRVQVRTTRLADNLHVAEAAPNIGNVVFLTGPEGVLIVDTMSAVLHDKLLAAIRATGATGPIRYVINTHLHGDHTGGNGLFKGEGAAIVAQENELKRMAAAKADGRDTPKEIWPTVVYRDRMTLRFNGEEVEIIHPAPAHTDGDSIVWFRRANVMHVGDLPASIRYPVIGVPEAGSVDGMIAGGEYVMRLANAQTKIVSGHTGPLVTFREISVQIAMLKAVRDRVAALISEGKGLEQVIAAKPTKDFDEGRLGGSSTPDRFVATVYTDLSRKSPR